MPTLDFKGKPFVYSHHLSVPFRELVVDAKKSLSAKGGEPSLDDNLIIHGDNLEALKALLPRYAGKVDVIYIDPPYNTGNEGWAYNDNVNSPLMKEWLGKVVDKEDLERHDKWLCMMWPRLQLLRELLTPTGAIFVSIDDGEQASVRAICEEIFGANNFIANQIWQKKYSPANDATWFSDDHDFVVCFARDKSLWRPKKVPRSSKQNKAYKNPDTDSRGLWKAGDYTSGKTRWERPNGWYAITNPNSGQEIWPDEDAVWRYVEEEHDANVADNRVWWGAKGQNNVPAYKRFLEDVDDMVPRTILLYEDVGHNQDGAREIKQIFDAGRSVFANAKPSTLLEKIIATGGDENVLVLDSFAGSGTTAHAVLALNNRVGGNRKFILVECEKYADTLTAERVRRISKGIKKSKDESLKAGLGGTFTYCTLGDPIDLERFFDGKSAPEWEQVARYVAYTATGQTLAKAPKKPGKDWFVGEAGGYRIHLVYEPDVEFMRSNKAALDMGLAERISKCAEGKPVLIYAAAKFMGQKDLSSLGLTFCQLPYAIHRILGDGPNET
jgi:adenine-specific DNA-methyltransferase